MLRATLTLIAFSRYAVGFGSRCFFIALAASFAGGASGITEERVANVITGGLFGLIAMALDRARLATRHTKSKSPMMSSERQLALPTNRLIDATLACIGVA